jgi:hypothetical protein
MKNALTALMILASAPALAQNVKIKIDPNGMGMGMQVEGVEDMAAPTANVKVRSSSSKVEERTENGFKYRYESNDSGKSLLRVLQPEGAHVDIYDGTNSWASEDIPMSVQAQPDKFYRFVIRWPNGAMFEKKLAAKPSTTLTLWVAGPNVAPPAVVVGHRPPPPQEEPAPSMGPAGMNPGEFDALKEAIEGESFSDGKLGVLRSAADEHRFTCAQVGELLDLYPHSSDKISALGLVKRRIVDPGNKFKIFSHFTFSSDKEKAQQMLR